MDLKEILAVSGKSGLYKIISQTKNGVIVESLLDKKRMPIYATDKISNLEEISIYTDDKEKPLKEIFKSIFDKENGGAAPDPKSDEAKMKTYFGEILPDYDRDRVYTSDIKKVYSWYNLLLKNDLMTFEEEVVKEEESPLEEASAAPVEAKKPVAKGVKTEKKEKKAPASKKETK